MAKTTLILMFFLSSFSLVTSGNASNLDENGLRIGSVLIQCSGDDAERTYLNVLAVEESLVGKLKLGFDKWNEKRVNHRETLSSLSAGLINKAENLKFDESDVIIHSAVKNDKSFLEVKLTARRKNSTEKYSSRVYFSRESHCSVFKF
jgi:hypothetical protein